jgi:hypothetical protein
MQIRRYNRFKERDELVHALGRQVHAKQLDGDETVLLGLVRAKDRPERSCPDLMKHAKWTKGIGRRKARSVRVQ